MSCDTETRLLISRYADGEARGADAARAARHLETCDACRERAREWSEQRELFTWAHTRAVPALETSVVPATRSENTTRPAVGWGRWRDRFAPKRTWLPATAAGLATVAALALWYRTSLPPLLEATADGRSTPVVRVASGGRLELGAGAHVTRLGQREVRLDRGWLRADVRRGDIVIRTKRMEVRDIGTRFQVATGTKADTVFVEAGAVVLRRGGSATTVRRDEFATVADRVKPVVARFPAWTREEDADGQPLVSTEPFVPSSGEELDRRAAVERLAARFPNLRVTGVNGSESISQGGQDFTAFLKSAAGLRAGMRAHLPEIARWMAADTRGLGVWTIPVGVLGLNGASAPVAVPAGTYRVELASTGNALVWRLEDAEGNSISVPVTRSKSFEPASQISSASGVILHGISDEPWLGADDHFVLQLADWPGATKPTLRLRLTGEPTAEARADIATALEELQRDLPDVPLKMDLWSTELLYLDPSRRHHLLVAWSAIQNAPPAPGRRAPGTSILIAALRSNVAWKRPTLPPGTYLLWWTWPSGAPRAHWEVSLPDGSQRRVLDADPAEPSAASQANRSGRPFPRDMDATLYRTLFPAKDGAFPVCVQVKTMREGKPQGTGWFRLSAP